jgi:hypothetical protein
LKLLRFDHEGKEGMDDLVLVILNGREGNLR